MSKSRNAIPSVHGAAVRRPGTKFVALRAAGTPSAEAVGLSRSRETAAVLIPHVLDSDNAFLYEFNGTKYANVYKNRSVNGHFTHRVDILPRRSDWTSKLSTVQQGQRLFMASNGETRMVEIQNDGSTIASEYAWSDTPEVSPEILSRTHPSYFASKFDIPPFQDYEDGKPVLECGENATRTGDAKLNDIIWAPIGTFPQGCVGMRMVFNPDIKELDHVFVWSATQTLSCYDFIYNGGRVYQIYHELGKVAYLKTEPVHTFGPWFSSNQSETSLRTQFLESVRRIHRKRSLLMPNRRIPEDRSVPSWRGIRPRKVGSYQRAAVQNGSMGMGSNSDRANP
jgi:hypothetical protein